MAKQHLGKKGVERFKARRLNKPKVDAKKSKGGPPPVHRVEGGGVNKPSQAGKKAGKVRKRPTTGGAFGGGEGVLPHGYTPQQRILLVGEGNFSFARALVRAMLRFPPAIHSKLR